MITLATLLLIATTTILLIQIWMIARLSVLSRVLREQGSLIYELANLLQKNRDVLEELQANTTSKESHTPKTPLRKSQTVLRESAKLNESASEMVSKPLEQLEPADFQAQNVAPRDATTSTPNVASSMPENAVSCALCGCALPVYPERLLNGEETEDFVVEESTKSVYCLKCSFVVKLCNCAGCAKTLTGGDLVGRILGRPYCTDCLQVRSAPARRVVHFEEDNPSQENAIRHLEDG